VHVYRWLNHARALHDADTIELESLPKLETKEKWTLKIRPGISTFGEALGDVGEYLQPLLDHALDKVPAHQVEDTPIFLMATAGVRLLPEVQQKGLLNEVCSYARQHTKFSLPDCNLHIQVIPGEIEGLYGWIAANYLLGGFDFPEEHAHGKGHHTYGFLDMGGASAQIAFAPNSTEAETHANDLKLLRMRTINGQESIYKVFAATWLGFGVNEARERYIDALVEATYTHDAKELIDPCLPSGLKTTLKGDEIEPGMVASSDPVLMGTGLFDECLKQVYPLLDKDAPCADTPCLLHGQHVPAIDFEVNHFVGVSEYWHTTHEVFKMAHKDKAYDFTTYQRMVKDFCSEEWHDIESGVKSSKWGGSVTAETAQEVCFKASWLINVLHDGIGIPRVGLEKITPISSGFNSTKEMAAQTKGKGFLDPFQAVEKIDGVEVSWTLGKMVLYACGQVPPSTVTALPVGFGSNIPGSSLPADFQEAGSNSTPLPGWADDGIVEELEELAESAGEHTRAAPSFLLFILILILIGYIFRKRERRLRFSHAMHTLLRRGNRRPGSPRKGGRSFFATTTGKLFGRGGGASGTSYERVLEDGEAAGEFELGDVESEETEHSDSSGSEGSRIGRTSGMMTPKVNVTSFETNPYFDGPTAAGMGVGLGLGLGTGNAMDRSGLVVRTESRERLGPAMQMSMLGAGRRSRTGSPTRGKGPLLGAVEEA
jgi:Golgi apyrase